MLKSVSDVTFASHSATHHFDLETLGSVGCGMLVHSFGCGNLLVIGRSWTTVVYADPEYPVCMLAMQELGCFQFPEIVHRFLRHGAAA